MYSSQLATFFAASFVALYSCDSVMVSAGVLIFLAALMSSSSRGTPVVRLDPAPAVWNLHQQRACLGSKTR